MFEENNVISAAVQKELNTPLLDPGGISKEDKNFLELLIGLINEGKINLYKPGSLINVPVYINLSQEAKGKVDFASVNLLAAIREIKDLHDQGFSESFQMQNLVGRLRLTKERLEAERGDLFII